MVDLTPLPKKHYKSEYAPSKRHVFVISMTDGFDLFKCDVKSVVKDLNAYVPINKSCDIKFVDGKVLIYEFSSPVRMKVSKRDFSNCNVKRIKFGDMYNYFTTHDSLKPIELSR